jgi:peptide/nickel transport system substrate-binding protein
VNKEPLQKLHKKEWHLPYAHKVTRVVASFTLTEKIIFYFFTAVLSLSALSLLWQVNKLFLVTVPDYGGSFSEGVVGSARFVNPLLAVSDPDRDLSELVYSGLLRATADGQMTPDIAESYSISPDGLTYTFVIRKNAEFQDGTPVTADDVVFTVQKAQDPALQSPRKTNWDGVTVKKIDAQTVQFILKQPYSPFIQNATLGILPAHIWKSDSIDEFPFSQWNIKAVGSGPYKIDSVVYTSSGLPSEYHLSAFQKYTLGRPFISNIVIKLYPDQKSLIDAYNGGNIDSIHGLSATELSGLKMDGSQKIISPLPRVFGVFFNQNQAPVLLNPEVRQALSMATDKQAIVDQVLGGYGQTIDEPVPPSQIESTSDQKFDQAGADAKAMALLTKNGWKQNANGIFQKTDSKKNTTTLSFSISTSDAPDLKATALLLQKQWQKIGAEVSVKIFEINDLNQNIIRPRKYDILLFGEVVSSYSDLYPFWHSSERLDPGLNVAMYTNLKVDKILETLRNTTDETAQQKLYQSFETQIELDTPAVFLYSPDFVYITPKKIQNIQLGSLVTPAQRFSDVYKWYIETNEVWKIFVK